MKSDVLIIHNSVENVPTAGNREIFEESVAGILQEVKAVAESLEKLGVKYEIRSIDTIEQMHEVLSGNSQEIIFNLVEELPADILHSCYVPAICRSYGRECTGNSTPALILAQNKWQAKAVLKAADVPTPESVIVPVGKKVCCENLTSGKYFVKPVFSDASEGIGVNSVVEVPGAHLDNEVKRIHEKLNQSALVERFVPDRELNVSLLEQNGKIRVLPIAEIDFSAFGGDVPKIVDYSAKWQVDSFAYNNTPRIIPAGLSESTAELVRRYAIDTWHSIGCNDYARVDFRMDNSGGIFVLEVNPNPDISLDAGFAAALEAGAIRYEDFVEAVIKNACVRHSKIKTF